MDNPIEELNKIIENLQLITKNNSSFTQIEKDIVLQKLREAYLAVLHYDTNAEITFTSETVVSFEKKETIEEPVEQQPEEVTNVILDFDSEQVVINEPLPQIEDKTEELTDKKEIIFKEPESIIETKPIEKTKEISLENDFDNDDILEFLPDKTNKNETIIIGNEDEENYSSVPFEQETIKEADIEKVMQPFVEDEPIIETTIKTEPDFNHPYSSKQEAPQKISNSLFDEIPEKDNISQKRSLNDILIEQKKDNSLNTKYQNTKISDLTKSISINDKFLFIRELFKNRGEEFSQAIQSLNNCNNIEEAFSVMEKMKKHYFWDSTSPAYLALCDLVRRKF